VAGERYNLNLEFLRKRDRDLAEAVVEAAASSAKVTEILHGNFNASNVFGGDLRKTTVPDEKFSLVLGLGDDISLFNTIARKDGSFCFIFEEGIEKLIHVMRKEDLRDLFLSENISFFCGKESFNAFLDSAENAIYRWVLDMVVGGGHSPDRVDAAMFVNDTMSPEEIGSYSIYEDYAKQLIAKLEMHLNCLKAIKEGCGDLAEYLGKESKDIVMDVFSSTKTLSDDWYEFNPETPEEIHEWYCKTDKYLYELCFYHSVSPTYPIVVKVVELFCDRFGGRILDFGGGDGDMSIRLSRKGQNVEYCDVSGKTMDFALWRFKKHGLNIRTMVSTEPDTIILEGNYDVILALDVLEHLVNPLHYCSVFHEHLSDNGLLIGRPSFGNDPLHPMHLKENMKYNETFAETMKNIGFAEINLNTGIDIISVWMKTRN